MGKLGMVLPRRLEKRRGITLARRNFVARASEQYCRCGGIAEKVASWPAKFPGSREEVVGYFAQKPPRGQNQTSFSFLLILIAYNENFTTLYPPPPNPLFQEGLHPQTASAGG